ncbi:uncharacterized protein LOC104582432 [Brachypodium distachyon]|uniref:C2H2-type domain-containing protein n=1 Tax=Brachypodium distachyon TaxID=15368 RepID=A0A0Q3HLA1_BRADI|nr:uncharacterized protein LOC104582432 [Brachypodium distachyon]KQK23640.1 hypothetical protein BRADI_1g75123v3 [Brachypodium distachyon]|eukprot:XP_010230271.1 uncharacterized protein LOC104582432 [Brachypodium distachyon]
MEDAETGRSPGAAPAMMTSSSPAPVPAASRRYYDCVFCKRGFTTAQALGGHMNVHRRDRPKPAAAPDIDAPTATGCYMAYPWPSAPPPQPPMRCGGSSFVLSGLRCAGNNAEVAVWPAAAAAAGSSPSPRPRELSLFGADNDDDDGHDDHDLRLGLGCHGSGLRSPEEGPEPERNMLDLELRLGPRPRH